MTHYLKLTLAAALATTSFVSVAQTPPPPPPPEARVQATPYVMAAGMSDLFEITSSQLAVQKSQNPAVRKYAQMLIKHHQKTTATTTAAAKKAGMTPTAPVLDPGAAASIAELQGAPATDFDRLYIGQQIPAHQAALDLHQGFATGGDQALLRATAKKAVPIVRSHLVAAQRMQTGMQGGPSGSSDSGHSM